MVESKQFIAVVGCLLCSLLGFSCAASNEPVPLARHFETVRAVTLSDEVFIDGFVQSLDVNDDGAFLVSDVGHVYLFGRNGELQKELNPLPCHPGFQWRPQEAFFHGDHIFVLNGGPWGFLFHADGSCWKEVREQFRPPQTMALAPDGRIYGWYTRPGADSSHLKVMSAAGKTLANYPLPASPLNNVDGRFSAPRGLIYAAGRLYHSLPSRPTIHVYDLEGRVVDALDNVPAYYRPITEDIPERFSSAQEFAGAISSVLENKTYRQSIHRLDENKLLLQYKINRKEKEDRWGIDVLDLAGNRRIEGPITVDFTRRVRFAKAGKIYQVVQPDSAVDGEVSNPRIEIYRFKR